MKNIKVLGLAIIASIVAAPAFAGETYVRNEWSKTDSWTDTNLTLDSVTTSTRNEWYDSYADKVYVEGTLVKNSLGDYDADGYYLGAEFGKYNGHEDGTINGDVNGRVNGNVNGNTNGHISGSVYDSYFSRYDSLNANLNGGLNANLNGGLNGSIQNGQYSGKESGQYSGLEGGKIVLTGNFTETESVSGGDGFSLHTAGSSLWGDFTENITNKVFGSITTHSYTHSNSHETSSGVR